MKKLLVGLLMVPAVAHAQFYTGNILLQKMNSAELHERALAMGYVLGVSDMAQNKEHCSPQSVTSGQTRDVVKQYLEQNPANRDLVADLLVRVSLAIAWPCPKKQDKNRGT
jgi:hypothetical protein